MNRYAHIPLMVLVAGLAILLPRPAGAQEFQAQVSVNAQQINALDRQTVQQMQKDIRDYMNTTRFTDHVFKPVERIKCNVNILINKQPSQNRFEGRLTIQLIRPVYNSTYESLMLKFADEMFTWEYVPFQQMQFSENVFQNNLSSTLDFYAFMMLGYDYDSFGKGDGVPFFQRARGVANLAANSGERGWQPMDGRRARYWLMENMLNNSYQSIHEILYIYHREGLDQMHADLPTARSKIMEALEMLQKLYVRNPNILIIDEFLRAKKNELVDTFRDAFPDTKQRFVKIMTQLDPNNSADYQQVLKENN